ncbi:MAG: hypothetical protein Q8N88_00950 [Nanoarchaeota archaeon]|nr:hypothetical protein [Nanoarchaeota archaeon]
MRENAFLRKELFWDVDIKKIDLKNNAEFIISRILDFGDEKDYREAVKIYGIKRVKETAKSVCYSSNKSLNFWSNIFNIPLKLFKCKNMRPRKSQCQKCCKIFHGKK